MMDDVLKVLESNGWTADGRTASKSVRIPTRKSPLYGKSGGELRTTGGRVRYAKGGRRVTVGPRSTCFYEIVENQRLNFIWVETKNMIRIKDLAEASS